jgi:hypothetical protein
MLFITPEPPTAGVNLVQRKGQLGECSEVVLGIITTYDVPFSVMPRQSNHCQSQARLRMPVYDKSPPFLQDILFHRQSRSRRQLEFHFKAAYSTRQQKYLQGCTIILQFIRG